MLYYKATAGCGDWGARVCRALRLRQVRGPGKFPGACWWLAYSRKAVTRK